MKPCPTCDGRGHWWPTDTERSPMPATCTACDGEGWVRDPLVPRDRGVASYRPLR